MAFDAGRHQAALDQLNANVRVTGRPAGPTTPGTLIGEVLHRQSGVVLGTATLTDDVPGPFFEQAACDAAVAVAMAAFTG